MKICIMMEIEVEETEQTDAVAEAIVREVGEGTASTIGLVLEGGGEVVVEDAQLVAVEVWDNQEGEWS